MLLVLPPRSGGQQSHKVLVVFPDTRIGFLQLNDLFTGMQYRGVIASTKGVSDLRQTVIGQFLCQRHGYLSGPGDGTGTALGQQVRYLDLVILRHGTLNIINTDLLFMQCQQVFQAFPDKRRSDLRPSEVSIRYHQTQRPFKLPNVGAYFLRDKESRLAAQFHIGLFGLFHQNGDPGFQLRRLNHHGQTPTKPGFQPLFHIHNFFREAVAGDNHLLAALEQGVKGVEKLFLGTLLARKELDIINQQCVYRTIVPLEFVDGVQLQCLDHIRHESFRTQIRYLGLRITTDDLVADGVHQVGFTQTNTAVQEQRVIGTTGVLGYLHGGGTGQLVRFTFDKGFRSEERRVGKECRSRWWRYQ